MCQISGMIAYGYKSSLTFLWPETEAEKKEAKEFLDAKNIENLRFHGLLGAVNQATREQEEIERGRKYPGQKPSFMVWLRSNRLLTRGDRSNGGVDWYRYFRKVLEPKIFP